MKNLTAKLKTLASLALVAVAMLSLTAFRAPVSDIVSDLAAAYNSAGNAVFAEATISDGTGVVTTVTTATTYVTVGTAAPLVAGDTDGSGCLTYTLASNKFTIAAPCGAGKLLLSACINDAVGANSAIVLGAWHRVRATVSSVASPIARRTEAATAVRGNLGCVQAVVSANSGDTYDFRYDSNTNGDTVTTRNATFVVRKLSEI